MSNPYRSLLLTLLKLADVAVLDPSASQGDNAISLTDGYTLTSSAFVPGVSARTSGWTLLGR
jgi:hypothetical protein